MPLPDSSGPPPLSPFGLPELQNMEIPPPGLAFPAPPAPPMITARMSSGMEPANAKRQHLSPVELQQRLSNIFGKPVGAREMSRLIPNYNEILGDPAASGDWPSMIMTKSDLEGLMDAMLESPRGQQLQQKQTLLNPEAQRSQQGSAAEDILKTQSYTYRDFAEAVDAVYESSFRGPSQTPNAPLTEARLSSMLAEYMNARLGQADMLSPRAAALEPAAAPQRERGASAELPESKSGLDDMHSIEQALPQ